MNCIKIGLPGKLHLSKRKGLLEKPILLKIVSENRHSGKTYFYTIGSRRRRHEHDGLHPHGPGLDGRQRAVHAGKGGIRIFIKTEKPDKTRFSEENQAYENRKSGFSEENKEFEPENPVLPSFLERSEYSFQRMI